jgi:hypothetical protein
MRQSSVISATIVFHPCSVVCVLAQILRRTPWCWPWIMLRWREKKLSTMFVCLRDRCRFCCGSRGQHSSPCAVRPSRLLRLLTFWTGGIRSRLPAQRLFTLCKAHEWPRVALTLRMAKQRGVCMSGVLYGDDQHAWTSRYVGECDRQSMPHQFQHGLLALRQCGFRLP